MAIQFAADMAPNGARHSRNGPETRCPPPPPAARPWAASAAKVDSHTVRKHSTWRQRPDATAMAAAMTDPPGPGQVATAVDPCRVDPEGLLDLAGTALAHAHAAGARIRREAVDVVEREPGVRDRTEAGVDGE